MKFHEYNSIGGTLNFDGIDDMDDLTGLGKFADSKVACELYEDSRPAVRGLSSLLAKAAKGAELLISTPVALLEALDVRARSWIDETIAKVPEARRITSPPEIAGPVLQALIFVGDENPIREMFINLLARSMDRERCNEAHPGFIKVIEQLSPDEATLISLMVGDEGIQFCRGDNTGTLGLRNGREKYLKVTGQRKRASDTFRSSRGTEKLSLLRSPEFTKMYAEHLCALNVISWYRRPLGYISMARIQMGSQAIREPDEVTAFTEFGELFVKACMPESETKPDAV